MNNSIFQWMFALTVKANTAIRQTFMELIQTLGYDKLNALQKRRATFVALWSYPLALAFLYRVIIGESPLFFTFVTTVLVFLAAYPIALDRQHFLSQVYYCRDPGEVNRITYLLVGLEVLFITLATYLFSCDYFNDTLSQGWVALIFLYGAFGLLWMQTQGFSELKFGIRRFYFKTSIVVGIVYSALMMTMSYNDVNRIWNSFDLSRDRIQEVYRYAGAFGKEDLMHPFQTLDTLNTKIDAAKNETLHLKDLVMENEDLLLRAESADLAAVLGLANKFTSLLMSRLPEPLNIMMMVIVNINVAVGFMFSTHLLLILRIYKKPESIFRHSASATGSSNRPDA